MKYIHTFLYRSATDVSVLIELNDIILTDLLSRFFLSIVYFFILHSTKAYQENSASVK